MIHSVTVKDDLSYKTKRCLCVNYVSLVLPWWTLLTFPSTCSSSVGGEGMLGGGLWINEKGLGKLYLF